MLADHITTNVRALEGALIRVVAFASLERRALDRELVAEALARQGITPTPAATPSVTSIQRATCEHFSLTVDALLSRGRAEDVTWARQAAMYLCRELTDLSLPQIGREFGGRDHTTILHAWRRVGSRIGRDPRAFADIEALTQRLSPQR